MISILITSHRPQQMRAFLDNIQQTLADPDSIEILVKIDVNDSDMRTMLEEAKQMYPFDIHYLQLATQDGAYSRHLDYQQLFELADKESYFFQILTDETRFKTQGWDKILSQYKHFFTDDMFRLKVSPLSYRNYYSHHDCGLTPVNFPFMTRVWIELAGGIGDSWEQDCWHQHIDYHLGQTDGVNGIPGHFRCIPIHDIEISCEELAEVLPERSFQEKWRMNRVASQQEFRRIAMRMAAYVWAENENLKNFEMIEDKSIKKLSIIDLQTGTLRQDFYYHLSTIYLLRENLLFLIKIVRQRSLGFQQAFLKPHDVGVQRMTGKVNYLMRKCILWLIILISPYVPRDESISKKWK